MTYVLYIYTKTDKINQGLVKSSKNKLDSDYKRFFEHPLGSVMVPHHNLDSLTISRYGMFVMKIGMVHMLRKFRVVKTDTMPERLVFTPALDDFVGGVNIKLERR